ncbi:MAG TPA: right-handed parallel beta-helix repeat-containing protein [Candidatus Binatia bacterium]|jgi:parallel beta-helix repeat protein
MKRRLLHSTLLALPLVLVRPQQGVSPGPNCGDFLVHSVTLTADLHCTGYGLVAAANGITIDLGGFTLSGDGDPNDVGIISNGESKVTIKHGTISGFDVGIDTTMLNQNQSKLKISGVTIRDCTHNGAKLTGDGVTVEKSAFIANGAAGLSLDAQMATITSTAFVGNAADGLVLKGDHLKLTTSLATANGGSGVTVSPPSALLTIQSNTFARNALAGIALNTFLGTKITQNTIVGNGDDGISAATATNTFGGGVGPGNSFNGNLVGGNARNGIEIAGMSMGNTIAKNRVFGNALDGIVVSSEAQNTLIQGNTVVGNAMAGVDVENAVNTVRKNVSNGNGLGFAAPNGVIDGGSNTARANANFFDPCTASAIACPPPFVPKAGPTTPTCGMHVTTSITLGADSPVCSGDGLVIDADGVTINLNGHTLQGNRSAGATGIDVGTHDAVTIENGVVRGFDIGIHTGAVQNGPLGNLHLTNVEVRDNVGDGAILDGDAIATVTKSVFAGNGGTGALFGAAAVPHVSASLFAANGGDGLNALGTECTYTTVTAAKNAGRGIATSGVAGECTLKSDLLVGNGQDGYAPSGSMGVTVTKSTIAGNLFDGIFDTDSSALIADADVVAGNHGHGIEIGGGFPSTVHRLTKSTIVGNDGEGLLVDMGVPAVVLEKNLATGNALRGFTANGTSATFTKNEADANAAGGILAAAATDGGGNVAHFNGGTEQCSATLACQ